MIVMLLALEMEDGNVSCDRAGSVFQLMVPTCSKFVMERVDNRVKLTSWNWEFLFVAIVPRVVLDREVNRGALLTIKLPEMEEGPSRLTESRASGPIRTLPATVLQLAMAVASA